MRTAAKVDVNHTEIVKALRKIPNMSVWNTHQLGSGFPDIIVGWMGCNYLFEIKRSPKAKLTPDERDFFEDWNGFVRRADSLSDVLRILGITGF